MAFIEWADELNVWVAEIDTDHVKMAEYINWLWEMWRAGAESESLAGIIAGLVAHTEAHFASEEKYMYDHGYPDLADHALEHASLVEQAASLIDQLRPGQPVQGLIIAEFLKGWLTEHIIRQDAPLGVFLKARGVG